MQVENNLTTYTYHPQTQNNNACSDDFLKKSFIIIFWETKRRQEEVRHTAVKLSSSPALNIDFLLPHKAIYK